MNSRRIALFAAALAVLTQCAVFAGQSDQSVTQRLSALEATVGRLEGQVAELVRLLKGALPPSPVEHVNHTGVQIASAVTKGVPTAKVILIEFSDYQCPFCSRHALGPYGELQKLYVDTGKVRYVLRNLPIESIHPLAVKAAEAAECAGDQGRYWEMHDRMFPNQNALAEANLLAHAEAIGVDIARFRRCLSEGQMTSKVRADMAAAARLGLTGTPAFLIGTIQNDGTVHVTRKIAGSYPLNVFREALDDLLAAGGA